MDSNSVDQEVAAKVKMWLHTRRNAERLRLQLVDAQNAAEVAEKELAKRLLPMDAKGGEKFCVWFGDTLLVAEAGVMGWANGVVRVRTEGTTLGRL
jgi:hypothetical protein